MGRDTDDSAQCVNGWLHYTTEVVSDSAEAITRKCTRCGAVWTSEKMQPRADWRGEHRSTDSDD